MYASKTYITADLNLKFCLKHLLLVFYFILKKINKIIEYLHLHSYTHN